MIRSTRMKKAGGPLNPACPVSFSMLRLFLGFAHHFCETIHIPALGLRDILTELEKVNGILTSDLLGVKGLKA
jgi:hypothetical protein